MSQSQSEQFCPECGSGVVSKPGHVITVRMPRDYPFDAPCETCKRRFDAAFFELGRRTAERAWRADFAFLMKTVF